MSDTDTSGADEEGEVRVLVELRVPRGETDAGLGMAQDIDVAGFEADEEYEPVPMETPSDAGAEFDADAEEVVVVRGTVTSDGREALEAQENVVGVYSDARIEPFAVDEVQPPEPGVSEPTPEPGFPETVPVSGAEMGTELDVSPGMGACAIPPCDCNSGTPKGNIQTVARYLGVDQVWNAGYRGRGVVVGVVDGGIAAEGRASGGRKIPRVIGGWPTANWGTKAAWGEHGNMCATDVLGMAPEAQLYDLRISDAPNIAGTLSDALAAYQWAITQHRRNGTPQVLSNSWGLYQKAWGPDYADDPKIEHPFSRKVAEAINQGITVLFAAGNCGEACPSGRCGSDNGPGKSIWGANGHPQVVTVGAVNTRGEFVGYSSQGPAALDRNGIKPDFLSVSHFTGYFNSDNGTSAATPVAAGVAALLKQTDYSQSPEELKNALRWTARDIGPRGRDNHSGSGILRANQAFDYVRRSRSRARVRPYDLRITGTQFRADINPGQTQRWFTWGWPSEYIADWHVRPTTPDGKVSTSVEIERDDRGNLTYWLTIKNTGSVQTGFEANYALMR